MRHGYQRNKLTTILISAFLDGEQFAKWVENEAKL